jgi:hypothetical protein
LKDYGTIKESSFYNTKCLILTLNNPIEPNLTDKEKTTKKLSELLNKVSYFLSEGYFEIKGNEQKVIAALENLYSVMNMKDFEDDLDEE